LFGVEGRVKYIIGGTVIYLTTVPRSSNSDVNKIVQYIRSFNLVF
jgi:hypothetical protein